MCYRFSILTKSNHSLFLGNLLGVLTYLGGIGLGSSCALVVSSVESLEVKVRSQDLC